MLLAAAQYLAAHRDFKGKVVFIFQPGEEGAGGALAMIKDGLFERFPVDELYGFHNWTDVPVGEVRCRKGATMAGRAKAHMLPPRSSPLTPRWPQP